MTTLPVWTPFRRDGQRVVVSDHAEWFMPATLHLEAMKSGREDARVLVDADLFASDVPPTVLQQAFGLFDGNWRVAFILRTSHPDRVRECWPRNETMRILELWDKHGNGAAMCRPNIILLATATNQSELDQRAESIAKCGDLCGAVGAWVEPVEAMDIAKYLDPVHTDGCLNCGYAGERYVDMDKFKTTDHGDLLCPECCHSMTTQFMGDDRLFDLIVVQGTDRPLHPSWVRSLRDQCAAADVCFIFGGWGDYVPAPLESCDGVVCPRGGWLVANGGFGWPKDGETLIGNGGAAMAKVGRSASGSTLDGVAWDRWPETKGV